MVINKEYFNAIKLADYIFFYLPIERHQRSRYYSEYDRYYFNDGHICGMCGEVVATYGSKGGVKRHLEEDHPEWIDAYIIGEYEKHMKHIKANDIKELKSRTILDILTQNMSRVPGLWRTGEIFWYFCILCGEPLYEDDRLDHIELHHPEWINFLLIFEKIEKYVKKPVHRYPLKPWKDPQSLFCSPNLKNIINKEPLHGDECKDQLK